jgi:hypothetical protein
MKLYIRIERRPHDRMETWGCECSSERAQSGQWIMDGTALLVNTLVRAEEPPPNLSHTHTHTHTIGHPTLGRVDASECTPAVRNECPRRGEWGSKLGISATVGAPIASGHHV